VSPRALAVRWTCERFKDCKFWTFTFKTPHTPKEGAKKWDNLRRSIVREWTEARLVRVFELHPSGHGLHVHAVTPDWLSVRRMITFSKRAGFGRVHVVRWDTKAGMQAGEYIAKYLSKARPECFKGKRLYGFVGIPADDATLQRDISFSSPRVDLWAILKHHPDWAAMKFRQRSHTVAQAYRSFISFDPTDERPQLDRPEGAGRLESLYLVIEETIRQGRETVRAHLGIYCPEFGPRLRKILAKGEGEQLKVGRCGHYGLRNEPTLDQEIDQQHEHETSIQRARENGIECPF